MTGSRIAAFAVLMTLSLPAGAASIGGALIGADGAKLGEVSLAETASGVLLMRIEAGGLPAGVHGAHIHQTGKCDTAEGFKTAGGHLAGDHQHGIMVEGGPHPGDLPNLHVGADDYASQPSGDSGGRIACAVLGKQ